MTVRCMCLSLVIHIWGCFCKTRAELASHLRELLILTHGKSHSPQEGTKLKGLMRSSSTVILSEELKKINIKKRREAGMN